MTATEYAQLSPPPAAPHCNRCGFERPDEIGTCPVCGETALRDPGLAEATLAPIRRARGMGRETKRAAVIGAFVLLAAVLLWSGLANETELRAQQEADQA